MEGREGGKGRRETLALEPIIEMPFFEKKGLGFWVKIYFRLNFKLAAAETEAGCFLEG
jgi:hypothetical protein